MNSSENMNRPTKIALGRIMEARKKVLNLENYRKVVSGTVAKVFFDHILVELHDNVIGIIYDNYETITEGMIVECMYACNPPSALPTLVFTEKFLAEIKETLPILSGTIQEGNERGVWVFFKDFGKVGYYPFAEGEKLKDLPSGEISFQIACTSHMDVFIYSWLCY